MHKILLTLFSPIILLPLISGPVSSQEEPAEYTLTGDEILIEDDDLGARHLLAQGNVLLTFTIGGDDWTLTADGVNFTEFKNESGELTRQEATAEGNIILTHNSDPEITITAPEIIEVNILEKWARSDSPDIHIVFPDGEVFTDSLEIHEVVRPGVTNAFTINTSERTLAVYTLSGSEIEPSDDIEPSGGNIFGDLRFDFSQISIETERTTFDVVDGNFLSLNCPDPTVITTTSNTLIMPSCSLTFDPRSLHATHGVELLIGEDTSVVAPDLMLTYPEGGMLIEFSGAHAIGSDRENGAGRVTISHSAGTFSADAITIRMNEDGTHRIHASGRASFEIPLATFEEVASDEDE